MDTRREREDRSLVLKGTINQYKVDKHQRDIVQHRALQPIVQINFKWSIVYKNIESLCSIPETNNVNQIYTSMKNAIFTTLFIQIL